MAIARDWLKTLRPASYRGVSFFVESDSINTGRRLVIHEFPLKDLPYIEDMGRKANEISVTAYLASDSADSDQRGLMRACEAGGAATLSLPMDTLQAHCKEAKRDFAKDKLGYVAFHITFVRDGAGAGPYPLALLARLVEFGAGLLPQILIGSLLRDFLGIRVPSFVLESAHLVVQDMAVTLEAVRSTLPLPVDIQPDLKLAIQAISDDSLDLVGIGATGDSYKGRSYVADAVTALEAPLVTQIAAVIDTMRANAEPDLVMPVLAEMARFGDDYTPIRSISPSRRRENKNREALMTVMRALALANMAVAATDKTYPDRRSAIAARATVAEAFDAELERIGNLTAAGLHAGVAEEIAAEDVAGAAALGGATAGSINLFTTLADLRGKTVQHLSATIATLAPVVAVSAQDTLPSLWWSQRLYGDAGRAGELASRNRVKHPSFMPRELEALAS